MNTKQGGSSRLSFGGRTLIPSTLLRISPQAGLLLVNLLLWAIFGLVADGFLSSFNLFALSRDIALFTAIGFAQMLAISMGEMNLSVGAIGGVAAIFAGWLMQAFGIPFVLAAVLTILLGAVMGWFNGWLTVRTNINSFIVTLAMASVYTGLLMIITKAQVFSNLPFDFIRFGQASLGFVSLLLLIVLLLAGLLIVLYRNSELGRWMLAVGANRRAAEFAGIPVGRTLQIGHALSGLLAGLAGVLFAARLASALPSIGVDWVLPSFLAPVLGGTILSGGVVSVVGTLFGGMLVESITSGLNLLQVNNFWVLFFQGIILLLAVLLDRLRSVLAQRKKGQRL
ncbi:ABC transporter permease [Ktedonobacteria bacterium brp13]|nr:ABC transporter permease [Ktedonobacteria bacterium brp13]